MNSLQIQLLFSPWAAQAFILDQEHLPKKCSTNLGEPVDVEMVEPDWKNQSPAYLFLDLRRGDKN